MTFADCRGLGRRHVSPRHRRFRLPGLGGEAQALGLAEASALSG